MSTKENWRGEPAGVGLSKADFRFDRATVAVIIPVFNQARFLADAIKSVFAQTRPADEVVVVDDGSTDDPATVVAQFQNVRLIRQDNRGLSAARNTGLRNCTTSYVVFLDSDDRLMPTALEAGLACIAARPDCAFVFGGCHHISEDGRLIGPDYVDSIDGDAHLAFLRKGISTPSMALFRCDCLLAENGFDETLRRTQDRDLYLRISQKYPVANHTSIVTEYRRHGQNMSSNYVEMLKEGLLVLDRHQARIATDPPTRAALQEGRAYKRKHFANQMVGEAAAHWRARHEIGVVVRDLALSARWTPYFTIRALLAAVARQASKVLPRPIVRLIERIRGQPYPADPLR
jgi:glycosyltransferase involved in cell wall biosynthesis